MNIIEAVILGFVQGLAEFLPVSSSGHLLLLQKAFGINEGGMFFSVMLHLATLIAVVIVYRKMIWELIKRPINKTIGLLLLALVPTVIVAILFKKVEPFASFYANAENGEYLGYCFLFTSVLLFLCDLLGRGSADEGRELKNMRVRDSIVVGCMQGIGVLPGVSRSGSTISGALFAGLDRRSAADFSFLLSIPSIVGGAVLEIPDALHEGIAGANWAAIAVGMVAAGVTGFFAVKLMLAAIKKKKLWGFAIYTAVLGVFVIVDQCFTGLISW